MRPHRHGRHGRLRPLGLTRRAGLGAALLFNFGHQRRDLGLVAGLRWFGDDLADRHLACGGKSRHEVAVGLGRPDLGQSCLGAVKGGKVQTVQHRVRQQDRDDLISPRRIAQHGVVAHLVAVLQRPIVGIVLVFLVVDVAAQLADGIAVHRFHRIVVQLYPVIADRPGDRAPATELEIVLHHRSRPGQPFHPVGEVGLDVPRLHLGAVDAQFPKVGVKGEQGFNPPTLVPAFRRRHQILLGHRRARPVHHPARAKDAPGHHDAVGLLFLGGADQPVQGAIAMADRHEFVGVKHHDPIGMPHHGFILRMVQGTRLRLLTLGNDVAAMMRQAQVFQPDQQVVGAIRTIVRIDHQIAESDSQMMRHPFDHIGAFVLHHRHGRHLTMRRGMAFQCKIDATPLVRRTPWPPRGKGRRSPFPGPRLGLARPARGHLRPCRPMLRLFRHCPRPLVLPSSFRAV